MALSVVVPRAAPVTAVSLVSVTNLADSISHETCFLDSTGIHSQQFINPDDETSSKTSEDITIDSDNQDISYRCFRPESTDSLFSLSSETICSLPLSHNSSLSWSPSLKESYKVKTSSGLKFSQSSISEVSAVEHHLLRRKSSISHSRTLSPTEYHPLNTDYQLDSEAEEYSFDKIEQHAPIVQQRSTPLFLASKFISFAKQMSSSAKVALRPNNFVLETAVQCNNSKRTTLLETFSQDFETFPLCQEKIVIDDPNFDTLLPLRFSGKTNRVREHRYNSNYLLIYALDQNLQKYLAQVEEREIDIFDQLLLDNYNQLKNESSEMISADCIFNAKFKWRLLSALQLQNDSKTYDEDFIRLLKLASIARYKVWSSVVLPPRSDELPNISNLSKTIVPSASLEFCEVPWLSLEDLKKGKAVKKLLNSAGFLRNSNIQFVSKNSQSKRWISYVNST